MTHHHHSIPVTGDLFETAPFIARAHCMAGDPAVIAANRVGDEMTFWAYMAIPFILLFVAVVVWRAAKGYIRTRQMVTAVAFLLMFSAFILSCGIGHKLEVVILAEPYYNLRGAVAQTTGWLSWITVAYLILWGVPSLLVYLRGVRRARERASDATELMRSASSEVNPELRRQLLMLVDTMVDAGDRRGRPG